MCHGSEPKCMNFKENDKKAYGKIVLENYYSTIDNFIMKKLSFKGK